MILGSDTIYYVGGRCPHLPLMRGQESFPDRMSGAVTKAFVTAHGKPCEAVTKDGNHTSRRAGACLPPIESGNATGGRKARRYAESDNRSVRTAIRRGGLIFICYTCCFLSCIAFSMPPVMAEDTTTVPYKDWWEYTEEEKKFLRERWTDEKVEAVVVSLKDRIAMPEFVTKLDTADIYHADGTLWVRSDLRGLPLYRKDLSAAGWLVPNLQGADLTETNLKGRMLAGANLQGAILARANLEGTDITNAKMQEANLREANLRAANLLMANLDRAYLLKANLDSANLESASMQDAVLKYASLRGADLFGVCFDSTYLLQANLAAAENLRYIVWGDSIVGRYVIGEEVAATYITESEGTISRGDFQAAEITYRDLKSFYEKELMYDIATEFHFRENEVITKRLLWTITKPWKEPWDTFRGVVRYLFLKLTYGYGSRTWWLLWYSLAVIGMFTVVFYVLALFPRARAGIYITERGNARKKRLTWRHPHECLYSSVVAFATVGYGAMRPKQWLQFFRMRSVDHQVVGWIRIFVGLEAALGIWVLALLVTVLFGR